MLNIYLISSAWHFISLYLFLSLSWFIYIIVFCGLVRFSLPWTISILSSSSFAASSSPPLPPLACCALLHQFYWLFPSFHSIECTISLAGVPHAAVSLSAADSRTQLRLQFEHCSCIILVRHAVFGQQSIVFGGTNCCHNLPMNMGVVQPPFPFFGIIALTTRLTPAEEPKVLI